MRFMVFFQGVAYKFDDSLGVRDVEFEAEENSDISDLEDRGDEARSSLDRDFVRNLG